MSLNFNSNFIQGSIGGENKYLEKVIAILHSSVGDASLDISNSLVPNCSSGE
jgi:hypothetical protein